MSQFMDDWVVIDGLAFDLEKQVEGKERAVRHKQVVLHLEVRHPTGCGLDLSWASSRQERKQFIISLGERFLELFKKPFKLWRVTFDNFLDKIRAHHIQLSSFLTLLVVAIIIWVEKFITELLFRVVVLRWLIWARVYCIIFVSLFLILIIFFWVLLLRGQLLGDLLLSDGL